MERGIDGGREGRRDGGRGRDRQRERVGKGGTERELAREGGEERRDGDFISGTGQYLLTGTEDGSVELHRLSDPYSLAGLKEEGHGVWSLGVHDNHYGNILCISLTYDDQYLLTGAGDGNIFVYKTNLPANSPTSAPVKVSIIRVHFVVPFCMK